MKRAKMEKSLGVGVKTILMGLLFGLFFTQAKAGAPTWSVNPADYQYTMTVTAVLDINCTEVSNTSNILGAFIDGECRGKINSQTIYNGKYLALITVYSNVATGESVSFKIYEANTDIIYDAKNLLTFENNGKYGSLNSPYSVITNYKPTNIALSATTIDENSSLNTVIGTLSTTDADPSDTHTYSFVSGTGDTHNSKFTISGTSLKSNTALNYESQSSYSVLIQTIDNRGCSYTKQFTILVNNLNDQPTDIYISNTSQPENTTANTTIGTFTTEDQDVSDVFTYSLVSGTGSSDNGYFTIEGNELKNNNLFDYEVKSTFNIRIKTDDGAGGSFEKTFIINASNVNDSPTDIILSSHSVTENLPASTTVATISSTDQDVANTFTYSFVNVANSDNGSFVIVGDQLKTSTSFDFEVKNVYYIYLQTKDNSGATFEKQLIINVVDANDAPTGLDLTNVSILEGKPTGTVIGTFVTTDPDANDTHTYSLVSGIGDSGNDSFNISGSSLVASRSFSYKTHQSFSILVKVEDVTGGSFTQQFTIQIKDINNPPTNITLSSNSILESSPLGTVIGSFTTTDADVGDGHHYTLEPGIGGEDNNAFTIVDNTLKTNSAFNFETKSSYSILVKSEDEDDGAFTKQFTITITDSNDPPYALNLDIASINENLPVGTVVGTLSTEDEDTGDNHSYTLINSNNNDNTKFQLVGDQLKTNTIFDFEDKVNYQIEVKTDDGKGGTLTKQFDITVLDANDAPTTISLSNDIVEENKPTGTNIGSFSTTDQDVDDNHTYSLVSGSGGEDNLSFKISGDFLTTNEIFKYNTKTQYSILVQSDDSKGGTFTQQFIILIANGNDAPTAINLDANTIDENAPENTYIGTFTTVDEDLRDQFKYYLVVGTGGKDNASFKLVEDKLYSIKTFDFESKSSLEIRIKTQDSAGASFESPFIIKVNDVNEKPVAQDATFDVEEDLAIGEIIGLVEANDIDQNQILAYSILSTDTIPFEIDQSSGEIKLSGEIDYESIKVYEFKVLVQDNGQEVLADTSSVLINIQDKAEEGFLPANNYMSPNGDGKNDYWVVENVELYQDFELRIFNGSGELVYHKKNNYQNDWDGSFNGKILPSGYYMYYFKKESQLYKGIISIIR